MSDTEKESSGLQEYLETTVDKFVFRVATDRLYSPEGVWRSARATGWTSD